MPKQIKELKDFSGGLNTKHDSKDIKDNEDAISRCGKYLHHIKDNICGNFVGKDKRRAVKYLLYWMADALVNPTRRSTAIALRGGQGTGKGQFV